MPKRIPLLMATTMALAVLLVGGVALADVIVCTLSNCIGTPRDDQITGTNLSNFIDGRGGDDTIEGRADNDTIHGRGGADEITGDGANNPSIDPDGGDFLFGEGGGDTLEGEGGVNTYFGGRGSETIDADYDQTLAADNEEINGNGGNDEIFADDGFVDNIHCGGGSKDIAHHDQEDVVSDDCEIPLGPG